MCRIFTSSVHIIFPKIFASVWDFDIPKKKSVALDQPRRSLFVEHSTRQIKNVLNHSKSYLFLELHERRAINVYED